MPPPVAPHETRMPAASRLPVYWENLLVLVMTGLIGIGGISTIDDVMEFFVAGASAVQIGTANYYDPTVTMKLVDGLPAALLEADATCIRDIVGTLRTTPPSRN